MLDESPTSRRYLNAFWTERETLKGAVPGYLAISRPLPDMSFGKYQWGRIAVWALFMTFVCSAIVSVILAPWLYPIPFVAIFLMFLFFGFFLMTLPFLGIVAYGIMIKGRRYIPRGLAYRALATLGLIRWYIHEGDERWARMKVEYLMRYPCESLKMTGAACLSYLEWNFKDAYTLLRKARKARSFQGRLLSDYLESLDALQKMFEDRAEFYPITGPFPLSGKEPPRAPHAHHHHDPRVVQNIYREEAGTKVNIEDSVVVRSKVGDMEVDGAEGTKGSADGVNRRSPEGSEDKVEPAGFNAHIVVNDAEVFGEKEDVEEK